MRPWTSTEPLEGSKKTSREDDAESSNNEANAGGRSELPLAIYMARIAYLKLFKYTD